MITAPISAVLSFCCGIGFVICVAVVLAQLQKRKLPQVVTTKESAAAKESHPCEVRHELISIDMRPTKTADGQVMTILLRRCSKCREHYTTFFAGEWGLKDFLRERSEIAELEGMLK